MSTRKLEQRFIKASWNYARVVYSSILTVDHIMGDAESECFVNKFNPFSILIAWLRMKSARCQHPASFVVGRAHVPDGFDGWWSKQHCGRQKLSK